MYRSLNHFYDSERLLWTYYSFHRHCSAWHMSVIEDDSINPLSFPQQAKKQAIHPQLWTAHTITYQYHIPSSMVFSTARNPSRTASFTCVMVCLLGPRMRIVTDCGFLQSSMNVYLSSPWNVQIKPPQSKSTSESSYMEKRLLCYFSVHPDRGSQLSKWWSKTCGPNIFFWYFSYRSSILQKINSDEVLLFATLGEPTERKNGLTKIATIKRHDSWCGKHLPEHAHKQLQQIPALLASSPPQS